MKTKKAPTVQVMLSVFLRTLRYHRMAQDVLRENNPARLRTYATVILVSTRMHPQHETIRSRFEMLNLCERRRA